MICSVIPIPLRYKIEFKKRVQVVSELCYLTTLLDVLDGGGSAAHIYIYIYILAFYFTAVRPLPWNHYTITLR